ncbi:MAG: D-aspartate ligase [Actinomycetota bacterium]|nr:D-aspartate ligase [Actinomycetota bacterium]
MKMGPKWGLRWRSFVVAWSLSAWLVAGLHASPPFAFIVVGSFLAICPGAPLVRGFRTGDPLRLGVLLVGSSFALDCIVAESLLYLHVFTGARVVAILAIFATLGMVRRGSPKTPTAIAPVATMPPPMTLLPAVPTAVELDPSLPVLLVRIGRYPVYHGTVGAIRTFGRAGVPVYAIVEDAYTPAALSRYLTGSIVWPTRGDESDEYFLEGLSRIGKQLGGGVLAIPSDDEAAVFLAEHRDALSEWFVYPDIQAELPRRLASKRGLYGICRKHDIPTPASVFPSSHNRIETFASRATYPVVVKNVEPWLRLHSRAVGGTTVVQSEEQLLALAETFPDPHNALFQEYIPVGEAEDWIFHAYCNAQSEPLVHFTGVKLRSWPPHAGVTTYARVVRNDELTELSTKLCREIGYHGVCDLDWRFDRRDGRYKLVDFNPRVGAQFRLFENELGIDVLRALHLDTSGRPVPSTPTVNGRGIVVENLDLPAAVAYRGKRAPAPQGAEAGQRAERAWLAGDDLLPFAVMLVRFAPTVLTRLLAAVSRRQARSATPRARRGAAKSVPQTKRMSGPNVAAADNPAKNSPGTDDSKDASSAGYPRVRMRRLRKSASSSSIESTSTR